MFVMRKAARHGDEQKLRNVAFSGSCKYFYDFEENVGEEKALVVTSNEDAGRWETGLHILRQLAASSPGSDDCNQKETRGQERDGDFPFFRQGRVVEMNEHK